MKKALVLLTDCYPVSAGEFFLEDEMRIIAAAFDEVHVVIKEQPGDGFPFFIPENLQVHTFSHHLSASEKLKGIFSVTKSFFRSEIRSAFKNRSMKERVAVFKVMLIELLHAKQIVRKLEALHHERLKNTANYYYSYWHSRNALALALLPNHHNTQKRVSRAHGWDVYAERHDPKYLPFKQLIVSRLDQTLTISDSGKQEFLNTLGQELGSKVSVSRLGKINHRQALLQKQNEGFLFCSCSNLIPLKRVHLVIALLKALQLDNVRWVHYGDGLLMNEMKKLAQEEIPDIHVEFRGNRPNAEILDFYAQHYVDLFINFSEYEGIPVSIMEALSAGIPVLATNVGGTSEIMAPEHGLLVEKDFELQEVKNAVSQFLSLPADRQEEYRRNAYLFWQENYSAEKNYSLFLQQLLHGTNTN